MTEESRNLFPADRAAASPRAGQVSVITGGSADLEFECLPPGGAGKLVLAEGGVGVAELVKGVSGLIGVVFPMARRSASACL